MAEYTYYPGCSVKGTGKHYEQSLQATFKALDLKLNEIEDWNCCGATFYMSVDEMISFTLSARNLSLAEKKGDDVVTPCSACYLALLKTQDYLARYPEIRSKVDGALDSIGRKYEGSLKVRHPLDILHNDLGLDAVKAKVSRSLKGLKVVPYYGCQIVRPYAVFDDASNPTTMDDLIEAVGAEVVDYPLKTKCCGGSLIGTVENVGLRLSYNLLKEAKKRGADVIVTICPLCQHNLECYQGGMEKKYDSELSIPVLYFTQLIGLALGIDEKELGLNRAIVPFKLKSEAA
jgi:heterodisulfide reductase subunit B